MANKTLLQRQPITYILSSRVLLARRCVFIFLLSTIALLPGCKPDNVETGTALNYFDLKGYFEADTARLTKRNPLVTKTVTHNSVTETKQVHIDDWGAELNLFSQSDINKPAWRNDYDVDSSATGVIYRAKSFDLKTQIIVINKTGDKIKWLMIYNSSKNLLYQTNVKLSYYPDSLYTIEKYQKVRLLGANKYLIKGVIN
jgi:hypothetical protein